MSGNFNFIRDLIPLVNGDVGAWDAAWSRLTALTSRGRISSWRRIRGAGMAAVAVGTMRRRFHMVGQFADGTLLAGIEVPFRDVSVTRITVDSYPLVVVQRNGELDSLHRAVAFSAYFAFRDSSGKAAVEGDLPFAHLGSVAVDGSTWLSTDGSSYEIRRWTPQGRLVGVVKGPRNPHLLTPGMWADWISSRSRTSEGGKRRLWEQAGRWLQHGGTLPAYRALMVDDSHRIWAQVWALGDTIAVWDVFSADGLYIGWIRLPPMCTVTQITAASMVCIPTESSDQALARTYRLHEP